MINMYSNDYTYIESVARAFQGKYNKTVSVVISHFNAHDLLERCLFGLLLQSYPSNLTEIIISDDGSVNHVGGIVNKFKKYLKIKVISHEHKGFRLATVRNNGILAAKGNIIVCLDCDIIPVPELVEAHLKWFHVSDKIATFGLRQYIDAQNIHASEIPQLIKKLRESPPVPSASNHFNLFDKRLPELKYIKTHPYPCNCFHGCNIAFQKDSAMKIGLFDDEFNGHWGYEDIEFGYRLTQAGNYLVYESQALGLHQENTIVSANQRKVDGKINRQILYKKVRGLQQFRLEIGSK